MSQSGGAGGAARGSGAAPGHMHWDTSELTEHRCALATAGATPADVVLNFGVKRGRNYPGSEVEIELVQRIALSPLTARHLLGTLERVIADYDRVAHRPR